MSDIRDIASIALTGLKTNTDRFEASAKRVAEDPHADLATEFVEQKLARIGFEANVAVLKTAGRMAKSLLDIFV